MKVLWFTNTPCSAVEKLGMKINSGGWLMSLEEELNKIPEVDLAICFYINQDLEPFKYKGTQFYPVLRHSTNSKLGRYFSRLLYQNRNKDDKEILKLVSIISIFNPDIIHIHGTEENFGFVHYHTDIPIIFSLQGILSPYAEKYFAGIPFRIATKFEGLIPKILAKGLKRTYKQFTKNSECEQRIMQDSRFIIGRTDWDHHVSKILATRSQYFYCSEILRTTFYENEWRKEKFNERIQMVTIIDDVLYKGFETIVNIAKLLTQRTNFSFTWKVIGLSTISKSVKIVQKWKNLDFKSINIELMGSKNQNEVIAILLKSDVYCHLSHIENSSNSISEAMILGMPVIATFAGGTSSLLEDKKEGLLVQEGEYYSIAGAIIELTSNFSLAAKYGSEARKRALVRHDKKRIIIDLLVVYDLIYKKSINT
jgi:glycosyltransferase involved in cell wall biosynthesis